MDNLNECKLEIENYIKEHYKVLWYWVSECKLTIISDTYIVYIHPEDLSLIATSLEFLIPLSKAVKSVTGNVLSVIMIPDSIISHNNLLDLYTISLPSEAANV